MYMIVLSILGAVSMACISGFAAKFRSLRTLALGPLVPWLGTALLFIFIDPDYKLSSATDGLVSMAVFAPIFVLALLTSVASYYQNMRAWEVGVITGIAGALGFYFVPALLMGLACSVHSHCM